MCKMPGIVVLNIIITNSSINVSIYILIVLCHVYFVMFSQSCDQLKLLIFFMWPPNPHGHDFEWCLMFNSSGLVMIYYGNFYFVYSFMFFAVIMLNWTSSCINIFAGFRLLP